MFDEAYFSLGICVELYPDDRDLADGRERFVGLKNEVRGRLASEEAESIESRVATHVAAWREEQEMKELPASGLGESPEEDVDSQVGEGALSSESNPEEASQKNRWKMPVVISLAGAGVVSGVVGGVMFGVAGGHQGEADDLNDELGSSGCFDDESESSCAEQEDVLKKRDSAMNLGTGLVVAGGGLFLGSLAVAVLVPADKSTETGWKSLRPQVAFGAKDLSLGLSGRF